MFTAKEQEFTDKNTGVTVTLGRHEDDAGRSWLRIAAKGPDGVEGAPTKTTTAFFDGQGEIIKLISHDGTEATGEKLDNMDPPETEGPFAKKRRT